MLDNMFEELAQKMNASDTNTANNIDVSMEYDNSDVESPNEGEKSQKRSDVRSRRPHKKSRNGCVACKEQRKKVCRLTGVFVV